jgi:hypothetical protein
MHDSRLKTVGLFLSGLMLGSWTLQAQVPSQVDQSNAINAPQQSNPGSPVWNPVETQFDAAPSSPGDNDLGEQRLLKKKDKAPEPFSLSAGVSAYWTDNVALVKKGANSDRFAVGTVTAAYSPRFNERWAADVSLRQQFFRYDTFNALDFNSTNLGAGLSFNALELGGLNVFVRYNFNLLTTAKDTPAADVFSEFYNTHSVTAGIQKAFPLSKAHYFYVGEMNQVSYTNPETAQRNEYSIFAGYHLDLTRSLELNAYYKAAFFDYAYNERQDLNQNLSLNATYRFTDWCSVGTDVGFSQNNSNQPIFDYKVLTPSGGVSLRFSF